MAALLALAFRLLRALALALDLPPEHFRPYFDPPSPFLRPLHYAARVSAPEQVRTAGLPSNQMCCLSLLGFSLRSPSLRPLQHAICAQALGQQSLRLVAGSAPQRVPSWPAVLQRWVPQSSCLCMRFCMLRLTWCCSSACRQGTALTSFAVYGWRVALIAPG